MLAEKIDDPTGNPLKRLKVRIIPELAGISAWDMADELAKGSPSISVRDHEVEHGFFCLDPCCLHPHDAEAVAKRLGEVLDLAAKKPLPVSSLEVRRNRRIAALLRWPDA